MLGRMPRDEAEKFFAPYTEIIRGVAKSAYSLYFTLYPPSARLVHTTRTRANIIRDHMVDLAIREFGQLPKIRTIFERGYFLVLLEGRALLRFKKLSRGRTKLSRNYQTTQAKQFSQNLLPIEGLPQVTRFDAGYSMDRHQLHWETISISCPGLEAYSFDIEVYGAGDLGLPATQPTRPPEITPNDTRTTEIRARDSAKKDKAKSDGKGRKG